MLKYLLPSSQAVEKLKCLNAKGCATWSRKEIDDLGPFAARYGAKGLAWIQVKDGELKGPIVKFFSEEEIEAIKERIGAEEGDCCSSQQTRRKLLLTFGRFAFENRYVRLGLIDETQFKFAWVVDFPLLGYDEDAETLCGRTSSVHTSK